MLDVTDNAFRQMFARYGKPDVMFTEFVSTDGLCSEAGRQKLMRYLDYTEDQRPIAAQIWGNDPEKFYRAAGIVAALGFDGIDINMGCPQTKEIECGACAALIRNPELAKEIIRQTKRGAGGLPVSVKTRLGYSNVETGSWVRNLLEADPAAITLHARTKKEMSKVPARWDEIKKAVEIRDKVQKTRDKSGRTLIIGNGDVKSREEGLARIAETGADGVMIGRGAFGNPWLFRADSHRPISIEERLRVMLEHAELYERLYAGKKSFTVMRKHFKAYASGFDGAHGLRARLLESGSLEEARAITVEFLASRRFHPFFRKIASLLHFRKQKNPA